MRKPLFRKIDCYMIKADDLDAAVAFYRDHLGQPLLWRTEEAVAFGMPENDAELVVHRRFDPQVDLLVDDADAAYRKLLASGATSIAPPFEIPIGRCAVVNDPFGNTLTVLDQSKGALTTNADGNVTGVLKR
jgi:lactoylglutathione lyase